ncbi:ParA family protein [uncultured Planktomarina sp.]|uniref:ParA family protein n=1 Tax=uncultured Planktomarina sp. TaxID=1538529 RepID=UPI003261B63A
MFDVQQPKQKIFAIANQKGGVGKTTTTLNLAAAIAEAGFKVLVMDLDPQGNASTGLGSHADARAFTTYDVLIGTQVEPRFIQKTDIENIDLVPSTTDLSSADIELASAKNRSEMLRKVLSNSDLLKYDYILLDCPPSLNVLTVNALIAAHALIIPLQSEFFALEGLSQLLMSVREVRDLGNPDLRIEGVVLTMYDARNRLSLQVEEDARENLGELVFKTVIPRNVRISEAPSFAMPVLSYDSRSKGAEAYRALAQEILARR